VRFIAFLRVGGCDVDEPAAVYGVEFWCPDAVRIVCSWRWTPVNRIRMTMELMEFGERLTILQLFDRSLRVLEDLGKTTFRLCHLPCRPMYFY
jgi:hypothetical protein